MMRSIAEFPAGLERKPKAEWEHEYVFRTITPVFGAGIEAKNPDEATPIRGTTVRGHLRLWWRATRGREYGDYRQLREREGEVWGNTERASRIAIEVLVDGTQALREAVQLTEEKQDLKYVLFPFVAPPKAKYWPQLTFRVRVRCAAEYKADAEAAMWAWANFGGVGSRTRRGCGAIFCAELAPPRADGITAWMVDKLGGWVKRGAASDTGPRDWASLAWPAMTAAATQPGAAWEGLVRLLSDYRQAPPVGRRGTRGKFLTYSRSNWPEADSLRAITGKGIREHLDPLTITEAFPRAEMGLPYVIQFKSRSNKTEDAFNDCTVEPVDSKRMASPLILRPVGVGPKGELAVPAVLLVAKTAVEGVRIEFKNKRTVERRGAQYVTDPRMAMYGGSPMKGSPAGSAVEGFLLFAQGKGYRF